MLPRVTPTSEPSGEPVDAAETVPEAGAADQPPVPQDSRALLEQAAATLRDPLGRDLAAAVQWWELPGFPQRWPVAVVGQGDPLLLLHGFDSSHLEFRRLAPLLAGDHRLYIPDLHGFGFCPRPQDADYTPETLLLHLEALLAAMAEREGERPLGLIGASMGGAVAVALARRRPMRFARLLLLAPAGLTGRPMPLPPVLDGLGVRFLALPGVRRGLCRSAFADPDRDVGEAELEIASLHLATPGWGESLRRFARSGGFAGCGDPLPPQPLQVLWGADDRILRPPQRRAAEALLGARLRQVPACGHLPHIDQPELVARVWREGTSAVLPALAPGEARPGDPAPEPLLRILASLDGMGPGRRRLVVLLSQLGDFDSLEYAQALVGALPALEAAQIGLQAIAIGDGAGRERFCRFTGFPAERLHVVAGVELHRSLGLYGGLQGVGGPWPALLLMCAGIGSPGTLAEVLRGYVGDRSAPPRLNPGQRIQVGSLPPLPASLFATLGEGYQRPFELATVRLRNMVEVLGHWRTYVPSDATITQRGGTFLLERDDRLLYSWRDPGLLGFSPTMARPLSFLDPWLQEAPATS